MAIALHHPGKLHKRNRAMLGMSGEQLRDFATKQGRKRKKYRLGDVGK